ncbi:MAG: DNA alkylation repair protein [Phycisphaerae bacterium]|nr:DNA alkylation repair protein [Phycisphaerae bacterium]
MATISTVRARAREIARAHRDRPRALAEMAVRLAGDGEEQLGFELFRASRQAVASLGARQIEALLGTLHDWNSTDCFACFVSGVAWREGSLSDAAVARWCVSKNLWTRRAALASTVPLNLTARGATAPNGEAARTLAVCERLVDDREDMVVKALSWALRVLAMKDPRAVAGFVKKHEHRLAARVLRETRNKLTTGLKNPGKTVRGA